MDQGQSQSLTMDQAVSQLTEAMSAEPEEKEIESPESPEVEADDTPDDSTDDAPDDESDDTPADSTDTTIETVADLAEALGKSVDDVEDGLTATVKINGEEKTVTLKELKAGYQMEQDYRHKTHQLAEEKRGFETARNEQVADIQKNHQLVGQLFAQVRNAFIGQVDNAGMERLKHEDPARYVIARQELADRIHAFDQIAQQGASAWNDIDQKQSADKQTKLATYAEGEREKLTAAIPGWSETKAKDIFGYLQTQGFAPDQLNNVFDHREIVLAHKAMLWDQRNEQAKVATAKVKQLPKLAKPGAGKKSLNVNSEAVARAQKRFSQTRSLSDAAKALASRL